MRDNLFEERPPIEEYYKWRDARVMDEVHWYGWFIDYWMEGGLMRDVLTHKLTTQEHWNVLRIHNVDKGKELEYENFVSPGTVVTPTYDPHCINDVADGCVPVATISADKLRDYDEGPGETAKIARAIKNDVRTGQYVIEDETWDCIWSELIEKKKGPKRIDDRPGYSDITDHYFSKEMLDEMVGELDRLITKYSGPDWSDTPPAVRLVEILQEHSALIQIERHEVVMGARKLSSKDFLGSDERSKRGLLSKSDTKDYSKHFSSLESQHKHRKISQAWKRREDVGSDNNGDFVRALAQAVSQIKTMEEEGGSDRATAVSLLENIRELTMKAKSDGILASEKV